MADENISGQSSKYNEAALQILRLHNLWVKIEESVDKGNLTRWKYLLDSVWRELYADVFHMQNPKQNIIQNNNLRKKVSLCKSRDDLYEALNDRHEFLKKIQDDAGKGGVYEDDTETEFE